MHTLIAANVGTVEDDSACTTPQAKLGNSGNSMKNKEAQLDAEGLGGQTFHALAWSERSSLCRRTYGCPEAAAGACFVLYREQNLTRNREKSNLRHVAGT